MTGACIPRHATFPMERETKTGDFVYLAPEVLKNDLYVTSADVYGFGLLIYELISERPAFEDQRQSETLKSFTEKVQSCDMLHIGIVQSECIRDIIRQCTATLDSERPPMESVTLMLKELKDNDVNLPKTVRSPSHTPGYIFRRSRELGKNSH